MNPWNRRHLPPAIRLAAILLAAIAALVAAAIWRHRSTEPFSSGEFPQEAYLWQRAWDGRVQQAITHQGTNFSRLVLLAAEVSWDGATPRLVRAEVDFAFLRNHRKPIGLALRIGPFGGPFSVEEAAGRWLKDLAGSLIQTARSNQVALSEFQIDFDCAASKLAGYRQWVEALRSAVAPLPLTITVLPAWLKHAEFSPLVRATDGYVLQVHSLERPRSTAEPFDLCDPAEALRWVGQAARIGVPFRVALPTYGYRLAFDAEGRLLGLSAEGPEKIFSRTAFRRELRADPAAMAGLVRQWVEKRPTAMGGVIWYRLPVAGDSLNWSWATMSEVIAGRAPASELRIVHRSPQAGLKEVALVNEGRADFAGEPTVRARWEQRRLVAADGLGGFTVSAERTNSLEFSTGQPVRLVPGEERWIGWLRLDPEGEVTFEWR